MFCKNCGEKLPDKSKVCSSCGMVVGSEKKESNVVEHSFLQNAICKFKKIISKPSKKMWLITVVSVICLTIIGDLIVTGPIRQYQESKALQKEEQALLENADSAYQQAESKYKLGSFIDALEFAEQALFDNPNHEQAQELYLKIVPDAVAQYIAYAKSYQAQGEYELALGQLAQALNYEPDNKEALALYQLIKDLEETPDETTMEIEPQSTPQPQEQKTADSQPKVDNSKPQQGTQQPPKVEPMSIKQAETLVAEHYGLYTQYAGNRDDGWYIISCFGSESMDSTPENPIYTGGRGTVSVNPITGEMEADLDS